jgi:hypothetical protein
LALFHKTIYAMDNLFRRFSSTALAAVLYIALLAFAGLVRYLGGKPL